MDLIYMNSSKQDVGVMTDYSLDLAYGFDENNFELKTSIKNHVCQAGYIIYIEGTEYGGMVDKIRVETDTEELTYCGRTWHGILDSKVICPDSGSDYLILNGNANSVLGSLITRMGLQTLFSASTATSTVTITNYKMNRYISGYAGIKKMLSAFGGKLKITFNQGFCVLSAEPLVNYSQDDEFDSSQIDFDLLKNYKPINHCICLGRGELSEREVVHLYTDGSGNVSQTQTFTGLDEIAETFDNSSCESLEELIKGGTDLLKEAWDSDELQVDFDTNKAYDIGDIVGARENVTGIFIAREVIKKIVNIQDDFVKIQYKVGD